ncbi:hypothetical protein [Pacificibacter marinus]|uniref:hypothetical protein n=1 Tax=Pacificibacter marinus TaxID=658057 RepID=UPI001C06D0B1|nr:hypothetical protein [Pacificibacter marinus]MBU2867025.1 hypothetical protein [Pacificibacter marinus]
MILSVLASINGARAFLCFPPTPFRAYISQAFWPCGLGLGLQRYNALKLDRCSFCSNDKHFKTMPYHVATTLQRTSRPSHTHAHTHMHTRIFTRCSVVALYYILILLNIKNNNYNTPYNAFAKSVVGALCALTNPLKNNKKGVF